jgi:hypothetical protein
MTEATQALQRQPLFSRVSHVTGRALHRLLDKLRISSMGAMSAEYLADSMLLTSGWIVCSIIQDDQCSKALAIMNIVIVYENATLVMLAPPSTKCR